VSREPAKAVRQIKPHGGRLISRLVEGEKRENLVGQARSLPKIQLNERELADIEMLAVGAMSPHEGFMTKETYDSVLNTMHLPLGLPWTIPVTLAVKPGDDPGQYREGLDVALCRGDDILGVIHLEDKYTVDKKKEAEKILLTTDDAHPGVQYLKSVGDVYLGGEVSVFEKPRHDDFNNYRLDPKETRVLFKAKGWSTITAFQTRNPIHRAHEYLQKCALEIVDGLLIHPLMGATKKGDIQGDVRMACYNILLENYYPKDRVAMSLFPAAMRYAGPREAIFHALVRKNYGCTHFIVGRDHAGVGDYYGTYDAQYIFSEFDREVLDVTPLFFEHAFYCKRCGNMASQKTCPHGNEDHVFLSGTKVREMLSRGEMPPEEFTRPEVARVLMEAYQKEGAQV
jgi:sulfate adenylyltransferase